MSISRYNHEGYPDPTTYEALTAIERQERKARFRPIVYICSPYSGDVERNTKQAQRYCRYAVDNHCLPIAPHLLFPQFMDDGDLEERDTAVFMGIALLSKCAELWVFGPDASEGMQAEINYAVSRNKKIRYFTKECKEVGLVPTSDRDCLQSRRVASTQPCAEGWPKKEVTPCRVP